MFGRPTSTTTLDCIEELQPTADEAGRFGDCLKAAALELWVTIALPREPCADSAQVQPAATTPERTVRDGAWG